MSVTLAWTNGGADVQTIQAMQAAVASGTPPAGGTRGFIGR